MLVAVAIVNKKSRLGDMDGCYPITKPESRCELKFASWNLRAGICELELRVLLAHQVFCIALVLVADVFDQVTRRI